MKNIIKVFNYCIKFYTLRFLSPYYNNNRGLKKEINILIDNFRDYTNLIFEEQIFSVISYKNTCRLKNYYNFSLLKWMYNNLIICVHNIQIFIVTFKFICNQKNREELIRVI